MPIYEYECLTCGTIFDKRQSFNDEPKADCPNGHEETRRLIAAPAIVFKGSGFYINDSKRKTKTKINGSSKTDSNSKKTENKEKKADSKEKTTASTSKSDK